jgi:hypothetical protein
MAPRVRALAQSESKARFMARLGLDERKDEHKQLYTMMKVGSSSPSNRLGVEISSEVRFREERNQN